MSAKNLDKILNPESIAVVGASNNEGSLGYIIFRNLLKGGFKGPIYPVNPKYKTVLGRDSYRSVADIEGTVDLAVVVTPIDVVPMVIRECARKGILGVVVISAGGKETGEKGKRIEEQILSEAKEAGIRIIGPNCLGVIRPSIGLNASFSHRMALLGGLAFISQSGALLTAILDKSFKEGIGFSYLISLGSMADVDFGDVIDYLSVAEDVTSIILYIESLTNARKFMSAARSVAQIKPVVVVKSGRSQSGAQAAASHTGAMAGEDDVYSAAFKRAGIVRVKTIKELFDCAEALAKQPRPRGPRLCIVTNAGGPGVIAADALEDWGYKPAELSEDTIKKLGSVLPPHWSRRNPVDILGDATPKRYRDAVSVCVESGEIDGLVVMLTPQAVTSPTDVARVISEMASKGKISIPIFAVWMGGPEVEEGITLLNKANIPTYETPEEAVNTFVYMYHHTHNLKLLEEAPRELHMELGLNRERVRGIIGEYLADGKPVVLSEFVSKEILESYGIPVNKTLVATSPEEAASVARKLGFPVVLKVYSPDITHKTEAGGVVLNLSSEQEVIAAYKSIVQNARRYKPEAEILGVTVQGMIKEQGYEVILGSKQDPIFGPVILFGMGGIMTEIIKDRAIALPPLNSTLARRLMEETKVYKLLKGFRNRPPVNLKLLEEILIRFSHLVSDFPEISEVDINPLFAGEKRIVALDARVLLRPTKVRSPEHMVISPYPYRYETHLRLHDGTPVFIRPVRPGDENLLGEFIAGLSSLGEASGFVKLLNPARYTQVDYDRDMVVVALKEEQGRSIIVGLGRVVFYPNLDRAELSIAVGKPWRKKGLEEKLINMCIELAKEKGFRLLVSEFEDDFELEKLYRESGFKVVSTQKKGIKKAVIEFG